MGITRCPACAAPEGERWRLAHGVADGQPTLGPFQLLRCRACGSAWLERPPPGGSSLYESGAYAPGRGLAERLPSGLRSLLDGDRVRLLGPLPEGARVIEIGAGRGRMVAALRSRGCDVTGIEPSATARDAARARGVALDAGSVESADFPPGAADLVVFWHVVEHLSAPAEALRRARTWARPGGRVVVAVPNLDSVQARIGGDRWFHQDVPRHLTQFSVRGLKALLERCGFTVRRTHHLMLEQNFLGMWLTLLNFLTAARDVPYRALKRDLRYPRRGAAMRDEAIALLAGVPLLPVAVAAEAVAGALGRAGTIAVQAEAV